MKKILFIAPHRIGRSPSQRFRFEQYFDYLRAQGWQCDLEYLLSAQDDRIFYSPGHYLGKAWVFLKCFVKRYKDTIKAQDYDVIFIQREAFMTGSVFFEKRFRRTKAKMVFDFDDSIWLPNVSEANKMLAFLKDPSKTAALIAMSDAVIAGNEYLAQYAQRYNDNVVIIPTTIDTDQYRPYPVPRDSSRVVIGWSGSMTTIQHFRTALPVLRRLKARYGDLIEIRVIGDEHYVNEELGIKGIAWSMERELAAINSFDIGIMPLPDDEWSMGKCGLKGLSYMAFEVPTIMSPVGVNRDIIQDGVNGYLASSDEEWLQKMIRLIEDAALRSKIGKAGRQTVIDRYSVISERAVYLHLLRGL